MTTPDSPLRESPLLAQQQATAGSYRALIWVAAICSLVNLAGPTIVRLGNDSHTDFGEEWIFVVLAEMGAASAYIAWSQRPLPGRLLRGVSVWLGIAATIAIGVVAMLAWRGEMSESLDGWKEAATGFGLVAIAIQTPLIVLRWVLRLRIASPEYPRGSESGRTSIADLLAAMTVVGAGLAFFRILSASDDSSLWEFALTLMGVLCFASALGAPTTAALMSLDGSKLRAAARTLLCLTMFGGIAIAVLLLHSKIDAGELVLVLLSLFIFAVAWTSILAAARHAGWRLYTKLDDVDPALEAPKTKP